MVSSLIRRDNTIIKKTLGQLLEEGATKLNGVVGNSVHISLKDKGLFDIKGSCNE